MEKEDYMSRLTELVTGNVTTPPPDENKLKLIFIGDSNSENLRTECQKNNAIDYHFKTLYTAPDIAKFTKSNTGKTLIEQKDGIIILTGTNHIRKNEPLYEIYESLKTIAESIPRKMPIIILETPPFKTDARKNN